MATRPRLPLSWSGCGHFRSVMLWRLRATALARTHKCEEERGDANGDQYTERGTADPKSPPEFASRVRRAWERGHDATPAVLSLFGQPLRAAL